jgi:glyoxylate reductase
MRKPRVFVSRRIPQEGIDLLQAECELEIWDENDHPVPQHILRVGLQKADGAILMLTDQVTPTMLDAAPNLRAISNYAVGFDNIPVAECTKRKIIVTNAPVAESIADLTWGLMLATARRLVEGHRAILSGSWRTWTPMFLIGQDLFEARLGIIGMGRIGQAVARRASGFRMRVLYHNRRPIPNEEELGATFCSKEELLKQSDFVVTLAPLSQETYHMIGPKELAMMKPTAILVNTGRGKLVDEKALYQALVTRQIWAAGLDVFEIEPAYPYHPLFQLDNVLAVPHIGSASLADRRLMAIQAAENLLAALHGKRPQNLVNWDVLESGGVAPTC